MSIKTIATLIFDPESDPTAFEAAIALAQRFSAHLKIIGPGVMHTESLYLTPDAPAVVNNELRELAEESASAIRERVSERMSGEVLTWDLDDRLMSAAALTSVLGESLRYADLVVVPAPYGASGNSTLAAAVEAALFSSRTPVLVIPDGGSAPAENADIMLAWNESDEALRAARAALAFMTSGSTATRVLVVDPSRTGYGRSDPGGSVALFLNRHGAKADILVQPSGGTRVQEALARIVMEQGAGLLVMGAYGKTRLREAIFGGTTRYMLEKPPVPVLMVH